MTLTWKQRLGKLNYILNIDINMETNIWKAKLYIKHWHYIDISYRYRHNNIVLLYGYMIDQPDVCLVYQLMANGSLEDMITCKVSASVM